MWGAIMNEEFDQRIGECIEQYGNNLPYSDVIETLQKHFLIISAASVVNNSNTVEEFSENTKEMIDNFHKKFLSFFHDILLTQIGVPDSMKETLQ